MSTFSIQDDQKKIPQGANIETTENISSSSISSSFDPNEPDKGLKRTLKSRHLTVIKNHAQLAYAAALYITRPANPFIFIAIIDDFDRWRCWSRCIYIIIGFILRRLI